MIHLTLGTDLMEMMMMMPRTETGFLFSFGQIGTGTATASYRTTPPEKLHPM